MEVLALRAAPLAPAPEISLDVANEYVRDLRRHTTAIGVTPCAGGLTNHNYRVELSDGSVALLRVYRWAHDEPDPQRARKEEWLHQLLARAGVPVPHVIARSERCSLMEWVEGEKLRQVALTEPAPRLERAWREAGAALRIAHAANPFPPTAGEIVGDQLRPFDVAWGDWHARLIREHAAKLRDIGGITQEGLERIERIADRVPALLGESDVVLVHNDAHPANVLVRPVGDEWRLAAWIDWEYAWVADADWDLTRFEFFGTAQVGKVPDAFWSAYGRKPKELRQQIYDLHVVSWLAGLRPQRRAPTAPELLAQERVRDLDALLQPLEQSTLS